MRASRYGHLLQPESPGGRAAGTALPAALMAYGVFQEATPALSLQSTWQNSVAALLGRDKSGGRITVNLHSPIAPLRRATQ